MSGESQTARLRQKLRATLHALQMERIQKRIQLKVKKHRQQEGRQQEGRRVWYNESDMLHKLMVAFPQGLECDVRKQNNGVFAYVSDEVVAFFNKMFCQQLKEYHVTLCWAAVFPNGQPSEGLQYAVRFKEEKTQGRVPMPTNPAEIGPILDFFVQENPTIHVEFDSVLRTQDGLLSTLAARVTTPGFVHDPKKFYHITLESTASWPDGLAKFHGIANRSAFHSNWLLKERANWLMEERECELVYNAALHLMNVFG